MYSARYGDLTRIAAWTDGDCHICFQPVDLGFYGPTGLYGPDTATVDHLTPQSHNGGDELSNLRVAHGGCNSVRGTRSVRAVRRELAETTSAPRSASEKTALAVSAGALAALASGYALAHRGPHGERPFNGRAAALAGLLVFGVVRYAA